MKIVLDTNCLLAIIPKISAYRKVYDLILDGHLKLAVTTEILNEYAELLERFYSKNVADNVLQKIMELSGTDYQIVYFNWKFITQDPDDNKFIDCAIAANAKLIVTNDNHFKALDKIKFPKVRHVKLEKFCADL